MNYALLLFLLCSSPLSAADAELDEAFRYQLLGQDSLKAGEYDKAMDYINSSMALQPDSFIYKDRSDLKKKMGDLVGAVADIEKAIELNSNRRKGPDNFSMLQNRRAMLRHLQGDLVGAIADYSQVLSRNPKEHVVYYHRGYAKTKLGDLAGGASDFAKAVELAPGYGEYLQHLADAKRDQGDFKGALADYNMLVAQEPYLGLNYFLRGNLHALRGDFPAAIKDYDKIIELQPASWGGNLQRAIALHAQGKREAALADYETTLSVSKEPLAYVLAYRELILRSMKRGTPNAEYAKIAAAEKSTFLKSIGLFLSGNLSEADFLQITDTPSGICTTRYFAGMLRLQAGDRNGARKFFEQSVATKAYGATEFILSRAELRRLAKP